MDYKHTEGTLQTAFENIKPLPGVGRVTVAARYDVIFDDAELASLASELVRCIKSETASPINLDSPQGHDISLSDDYPLLDKYLKTVTLHKTAFVDGAWIAVEPFGGVGTP